MTNQIRLAPDRQLHLKYLRNLRKPFWIPVWGNSMKPLLQDGDRVRVIPSASASGRTVSIGSLVLFSDNENGHLVVHRVVGIGRNVFYESGDRNLKTGQVSKSDILGTVTHRKRNSRTIPLRIPFAWRLRLLLDKLLRHHDLP